MNKYAIGVVSLIVFLVAGVCVYSNFSNNQENPTQVLSEHKETDQANAEPTISSSNETSESTTYTRDDIASHNNEGDCWIAIHGKVYDVTTFVSVHPGGKAILQGCGTDATDLYETRPMGSGTPHSDRARDFAENFYIGDLAE